jgi:hypothetical protein
VGVATQHGGKRRAGVRDRDQAQAIDLRSPEGVALEGGRLEVGAGLPVDHLVRPRSDVVDGPERAVREARCVALRNGLQRLLQQVSRQWVEGRVHPSGLGERLLPSDEHRPRIGGDDFLHLPDPLGPGDAQIGRREHAVGEREIVGGERRAVVPGQVGPEPERRFHAPIGEDAPALAVEPRELLRQIGMGDFLLVDVVEHAIEDANRRIERAGESDNRLTGEAGQLAPRDDGDRPLGSWRCGLRLHRRAPGARPARGRRGRGARGQDHTQNQQRSDVSAPTHGSFLPSNP